MTNVSGFTLYNPNDPTTSTQAVADANAYCLAEQVALATQAGGGRVELPAGTIYISQMRPEIIQACTNLGLTEIENGVTKYRWSVYVSIVGQATILRMVTNLSNTDIPFDLSDDISFFDSELSGVRIDGGDHNTAGFDTLFKINSPARHYRSRFRDCHFYHNQAGSGMFVGATQNVEITNCAFLENQTYGLHLSGVIGASIRLADFEQNKVGGCLIEGGDGLRQSAQTNFDSCYMEQRTYDQVPTEHFVLDNVEGVRISNAYCLKYRFRNEAKFNHVDDTNRDATDVSVTFESGANNNYVYSHRAEVEGDAAGLNYRGKLGGTAMKVPAMSAAPTANATTLSGNNSAVFTQMLNPGDYKIRMAAFGNGPVYARLYDLGGSQIVQFTHVDIGTESALYEIPVSVATSGNYQIRVYSKLTTGNHQQIEGLEIVPS